MMVMKFCTVLLLAAHARAGANLIGQTIRLQLRGTSRSLMPNLGHGFAATVAPIETAGDTASNLQALATFNVELPLFMSYNATAFGDSHPPVTMRSTQYPGRVLAAAGDATTTATNKSSGAVTGSTPDNGKSRVSLKAGLSGDSTEGDRRRATFAVEIIDAQQGIYQFRVLDGADQAHHRYLRMRGGDASDYADCIAAVTTMATPSAAAASPTLGDQLSTASDIDWRVMIVSNSTTPDYKDTVVQADVALATAGAVMMVVLVVFATVILFVGCFLGVRTGQRTARASADNRGGWSRQEKVGNGGDGGSGSSNGGAGGCGSCQGIIMGILFAGRTPYKFEVQKLQGYRPLAGVFNPTRAKTAWSSESGSEVKGVPVIKVLLCAYLLVVAVILSPQMIGKHIGMHAVSPQKICKEQTSKLLAIRDQIHNTTKLNEIRSQRQGLQEHFEELQQLGQDSYPGEWQACGAKEGTCTQCDGFLQYGQGNSWLVVHNSNAADQECSVKNIREQFDAAPTHIGSGSCTIAAEKATQVCPAGYDDHTDTGGQTVYAPCGSDDWGMQLQCRRSAAWLRNFTDTDSAESSRSRSCRCLPAVKTNKQWTDECDLGSIQDAINQRRRDSLEMVTTCVDVCIDGSLLSIICKKFCYETPKQGNGQAKENAGQDEQARAEMDQFIASKHEADLEEAREKTGQIVDEGQDEAKELLEKLVWQFDFASNLYIAYVCLTIIFFAVPISLYSSKGLIKAKRAFHISKLTFVLGTVAVMWLYDYVSMLSALPFDIYLHNLNADVCYNDPTFIKNIAAEVGGTCSDIRHLHVQYQGLQKNVKEQHFAAMSWNLCQRSDATPAYKALPTFPEFETYYNTSKAVALGRCNRTELWGQFTRAPGEVTGGFTLVLASGIIAQVFAKYILTQFGVCAAHMLDPLPFHKGLGEVASLDSAPTANDVVRFLKEQKTPWFCIWGFATVMCLINMCYSAVKNVGLARDGSVEITPESAWSLLFVMTLLIASLISAAYMLLKRWQSGAIDAGKKAWRWRGRSSRRPAPALGGTQKDDSLTDVVVTGGVNKSLSSAPTAHVARPGYVLASATVVNSEAGSGVASWMNRMNSEEVDTVNTVTPRRVSLV